MATQAKKLYRAAPIVSALFLFAGCSGGSGGSSPGDSTPTPSPAGQSPAIVVESFEYGTHEPNGAAAFAYMTGPEGTWKEVDNAQYEWNYYQRCANAARPFNKSALIANADGVRFFTAPDADCNLLWDANADGQLDATGATHAFYEHNGRGADGQQLATPFTNFWFDDNWLARYTTRIYGHAPPDGLRDAQRARWRILEGNTSGWTRYPDDTFDRRALNGIHDVATGDLAQAGQEWQRILDASGYFYDPQTQRYIYPSIEENYHLALVQILTSLLMDRTPTDDALVQHWVALRSNILSRQERRGDELLGWRSSVTDAGSLMNTETMSLNIMALGTGAVAVFEAGQAARVGTAQPGYLTPESIGTYPAGNYEIQLFVRGEGGAGAAARLEIANAGNATMLTNREVTAAELPAGAWRRIDLQIALTEVQTALELRTYWYGTAGLDIAAIRVRQR